MKGFDTLSDRETLALAISLEEEHERVYADFADGLREDFPDYAGCFDSVRSSECKRRRKLIELFRDKFGEHIPLIRRQDVRGLARLKPLWLVRPLRLDAVKSQASAIERESRCFYERAAGLAQDARIRELFNDLAQEHNTHEARAGELEFQELRPKVIHEDTTSRLGRFSAWVGSLRRRGDKHGIRGSPIR